MFFLSCNWSNIHGTSTSCTQAVATSFHFWKQKMFSGYNTYNYTFTAQAKPHTIARMFSANNTHSRTILHENIYVQFYTKTSQKLQLNNWALYTRSVLLMPFQGEPKIDSGSHTWERTKQHDWTVWKYTWVPSLARNSPGISLPGWPLWIGDWLPCPHTWEFPLLSLLVDGFFFSSFSWNGHMYGYIIQSQVD